MMLMLVLVQLALPAVAVRPGGLGESLISSGPPHSCDHSQAGLIETRTRAMETTNVETGKEEKCDKELLALEEALTNSCLKHAFGLHSCGQLAKNTIEYASLYEWQQGLASSVINQDKTPVFWAGFWPGGQKGIDTRDALEGFVTSVKGFQLANTEWGQAAESKGANNLENCSWAKKKNFWSVASMKMAEAMALHNVDRIIIALHKKLGGEHSFYKTILYQAELLFMGKEMKKNPQWKPRFVVHSIPIEGAPVYSTGCALASKVKTQLERNANRSVTVLCRTCTTLQKCQTAEEAQEESTEAIECQGDCQNGKGTKCYANGDIYEGEWKNGKKDGNGTYTYADGLIYEGQWKNGEKHGNGTTTYTDGTIYKGEWKNGTRHGNGNMTYANGDIYKGEWENGKRDGNGTMTYAQGDIYEGEWKNDKKDGNGTYTWADGAIHKGEWKNDEKDGKGTYTWADGRIYEGEWKNDKLSGKGT